MAATPWPRVFDDHDWRFEIKWDGVRILLFAEEDSVRLKGRSGRDATLRYPELGSFRSKRPMVLDGEIVALDDSGMPSFERLQSRMNLASPSLVTAGVERVPITYVVFDVLHDGSSVVAESWSARRERLETLELPGSMVRSDAVADAGPLWNFVVERGMEGVVAKRVGSSYRPGKRSPDWRKIASFRTLRAVVGGYTPGERGRSGSFGSLLIGLWDGDRLRWIGSVGSGFSNAALARTPARSSSPTRFPRAQPGSFPNWLRWSSTGSGRAPDDSGRLPSRGSRMICSRR
jgi:bifunctional non-homologous end joining protein LigD